MKTRAGYLWLPAIAGFKKNDGSVHTTAAGSAIANRMSKRRLLITSAFSACLSMCAAFPVFADGGSGGGNNSSGGADSQTGAGANGASGAGSTAAGDGAGAGTTGGKGGDGGNPGGGAGGAGGATAGANGTAGASAAQNGGGGGGGAIGYVGVNLPSTAITGGSGGSGGNGAANGGGGGSGGIGVIIGPTGQTLNTNITGGNGGNGGNGAVNGNGGDGGIGLFINSTVSSTLTVNSIVTGGSGGAAGTTPGVGGVPTGEDGAGGAGIVGQSLTVILNSGGGVDGGSGANAITFTGGVNTLELHPGYGISGNVAAFGNGPNTLILGGTGSGIFLTGGISNQVSDYRPFSGFTQLVKNGNSTWAILGDNTSSIPWEIDQGTLQVAQASALGKGAITFNVSSGLGTLETSVSGTFTNTISVTTHTVALVAADSATTATLTGSYVLGESSQLVLGGLGTVGTIVLAPAPGSLAVVSSSATVIVSGAEVQLGTALASAVLYGNLEVGSKLDLNGFSISPMTISSQDVQTNGVITNSLASTVATVTVNSGTYTGKIQDGAGQVALTVSGPGIFNLSNTNTYTGATTVNGGTLNVTGSTANSTTTVNSGGTLAGTGTVGTTNINGGTLAPGSTTAPLAVSGNLSFTAASTYMVQITPTSASLTNVTGTATPAGASVKTSFANAGNYVAKQYTILSATGGVSGTFGADVNSNLPTGFKSTLSYDPNNVYLNLALQLNQSPVNYIGNRKIIGDAVSGFFNAGGSIPAAFAALSSDGLSQAAGETATGTQQTTFSGMGLFLGVLTDPFMTGRDNTGRDTIRQPRASGYADETMLGYAAKRPTNDALAAIYTKASQATLFVPNWSLWVAGFGGSQITDGNSSAASSSATSRIYGTAVGADYRFSPDTTAGFALAGGGTNFSVNGFGTGRSDLFQAGAFVRHNAGPAYVTAALAYGWQDVTTNRTLTVAGIDQLQARFNANAYSGRAEGGYRLVTPGISGIGITPYAAAQFTTFALPAYAEGVLSGANTFALAYSAKDVTDPRSELGIRTDKSVAMANGILTLRSRAAWAHDYNTDRNIGATFQALPAVSFVVNGAAQAHDSALTSASAEFKWMNGWAAAAAFEGEFSEVTRSYAGKGTVRYNW